jgi:hypothetical protein
MEDDEKVSLLRSSIVARLVNKPSYMYLSECFGHSYFKL